MWTTDALKQNTGWDFFTFIFFGFIIYKISTKPYREMIWSVLKSPFTPLKNNENLNKRIKGMLTFIAILAILIFLIGSWLYELIKIIKIFV